MPFLLRCFVLSSFLAVARALWPLPRLWDSDDGFLRLSDSFSIELDCSLEPHPPQDLLDAIEETLHFLWNDRHRLLVVDRGESLRDNVTAARHLTSLRLGLVSRTACTRRTLSPSSISQEARKPLAERLERYSLDIDRKGDARLAADSTLGLFRGLQAFSQLVYFLPAGRKGETVTEQTILSDDGGLRFLRAPLTIEDSPAFPWRGIMLDTSRNHYSVAKIKTLLQTAATVAFSQFHWHIVDSHAWPLDLPSFPLLAANARNDVGQVYTPADVEAVTAYANAHGIDVVLEFEDMPGHTGSIAQTYAEHVACSDKQPWSRFAAEPGGTGQIRIAQPATVAFTKRLLRAMLDLAPSPFFSTGADEINFACYDVDEPTQRQLKLTRMDIHGALQAFTDETHAVVRETGKTPIVWEELAISQKIELHNNTLVAVWTNSRRGREALERNHKVIWAPSNYFYLDCGLGGWLGDPKSAKQAASWCTYNPWHRMYSFDPFEHIPAHQHHLIQGGQTLLWSEQTDDTNLEQNIWPRAAAVAEVFWHGSSLDEGRSVAEALPRLHDLRYRLVQRGIQAIPLQPHWCAVRPGECDAQ